MLMIIMLTFFIFSSSPFSSSMILLGVSFSVLMLLNSFGSWMSFIICLIYLGGILVLFIYISSISPNKKNIFDMNFFLFLFLVYQSYMYSQSFIFSISYSKFLFYSPMMFKFWMIMMLMIVIVLFIVSDMNSGSYSSFRSV